MMINVLIFFAGIGVTILLIAMAVWYHSSEYPRRRKLTPEQRAQEDRQIDERLSKL